MQILTVAIRVIQQVIKDTRTLAFLLFAPVFVLGLLYVIMGSSSDEPNIGVIDLDDALQVAIEEEAHIIEYGSIDERSEEHTSELQSRFDVVCRLLLEKKKIAQHIT